MSDISVIGLGDMGAAIARVLLNAGLDLTLWNRSAERCEAFHDTRAHIAGSVQSAIAASPTVIICISTHDYTLDLINSAQEQVRGRSIIELSTGDGPAATALAERIAKLGGDSLFGMILAGPGQIGLQDTAFLMAGSQKSWQDAEPMIRTLAPASDHIGTNEAHLADLFSALSLPRQGAMFGMIYGAHFCEVAGVPLDVYVRQLPAAMRVATSLYAKTVADTIPSGDFSGSGSPLKIYQHAFRDGFASFKERGANTELSDLLEDLIERGIKAGFGDEHLTALIKVLRKG
ncbi:MAG: NAD(P)-dependent oxidoreductase [Rhodobacteraceae bacterium]|nr:NAD(P)-dependent oxidoreductase [Paracoccaceae bacterium]